MVVALLLFILTSVAWADAPSESRTKARLYIQKVKKSPQTLVDFDNHVDNAPKSTVYLFIQGIEIGNGEQWAAAFDIAIQRKVRFYFHKIYNRKSLNRNVTLIKHSLREVRLRHPFQQVEIIAYSAGGAATLVAWRDLERRDSNSRGMYLTTVASPLSGYGVPFIAVPFVNLLFGAYNGKLARGLADELNGQHLTHCRHFVNMDCSLDRHSCPHNGTSNSELLPQMPCGTDSITEFHNETHESVLARAAEIIINF